MSYPSSDPYATPAALPPKPSMDAPPMRYMEAFQYIFAHPEWTMNVLLAAVCALIPVIGGILVQGYSYEILESLHRFPNALYPKFDFGRFSQYLMRGIWPFLVTLVVSMVVMLPMMCIIMIPFIAIMAAAGGGGGGEEAGAAAGLGMCCIYGLIFLVSLAMQIALMPFVLRAALSQDFAEAFKFNWAMDFLAKMWPQATLVMLFLTGVSLFVMTPIAVVTCFLGLYPALAILIMAHAHLLNQLYAGYLARGGEPIPLKAWDGPAPVTPPAM